MSAETPNAAAGKKTKYVTLRIPKNLRCRLSLRGRVVLARLVRVGPVSAKKLADEHLGGFAPTSTAFRFQTASWPWPGPTRAWASSCRMMSRTVGSSLRVTNAEDRVMSFCRCLHRPRVRRAWVLKASRQS